MNFFAVTFFIEGHNSQDWCEDHSRAMNPSHGLVEADRPTGFSSRHPRSADCIVSGNKVQISRHAAKSRMQVAGGCARVLSPGVERCGNSGNQRNGCDQTHPLMDLQHVGSLVEQGLFLGVVYKLNASGQETVLYSFTGLADGCCPRAGVIRDSAGNLYGTTNRGGALSGCVFGCGVVYKLNASGRETVLHTFTGGADGGDPNAGVIRDSAAKLYGTTGGGGTAGKGVVFKVDTSGNETVLYSFTGGAEGSDPNPSVIRDSAGNLYGTTIGGGTAGKGVAVKLDL